ncbi:uncharacterized protein LOC111471150 [Cucurbita maxima]|uniref:Uncharacterized protein LOC111471150 n=1 Tax=Cucurbita maxima TaxID=3661 RepID=A0A6J1I5A7_CUCMA|nr:uncharacterized protein LOC111471150 [Cucurbita maxima]
MGENGYIEKALCNNRSMGAALGKGQKEAREEGRKSSEESWDTIVVAISSSRGFDKLKFDEIRDVVLSESIRKQEIGNSSDSAFNVDQRGRNCTRPKRKHNHKFGDDDDSINSAEDVGDALILSVDSLIESWILDSGTSVHSSPNKELFWNFKSGNFDKVYLADNKDLEIKGKGDEEPDLY